MTDFYYKIVKANDVLSNVYTNYHSCYLFHYLLINNGYDIKIVKREEYLLPSYLTVALNPETFNVLRANVNNSNIFLIYSTNESIIKKYIKNNKCLTKEIYWNWYLTCYDELFQLKLMV